MDEEGDGEDVAETRDGADAPRERLRQLRYVQDGEEREQSLFKAALTTFLDSPAIRDTVSSVASVRGLMEESRAEILASVESDRATFRTAFVEDAEAGQRLEDARRRFRSVALPSFMIGSVAIYALIGVLVLSVFRASQNIITPLAFGVLITLGGALYPSTLQYLRVRRISGIAHDNLEAAEALFADALVRVGFAEEWRRARNVGARAGMRVSGESAKIVGGLVPTRMAPTDDRLGPIAATNLVEGYRGGGEVDTKTRARLVGCIRGLAGASIGVSGPRGIGKSTLIRSVFATERAGGPSFCTEIAAPVRYDPREFVLTLFAQICEQVLSPGGLEVYPSFRRMWSFGLGVTLASVGVAIVLVGGQISLSSVHAVGLGLIVVGALVTASSSLMSRRRAGIPFDLPPTTLAIRDSDPERFVEDLLRSIRYQLTYSSGYGGKLTAPVGELSATATYTVAARQESFPEIVMRFSAFLESLVSSHEKVLIGIDELDKLPIDDAVGFLNDIKGLFGTEGCFFVLTVSEDALAQFERRGVPLSDSFDSSFDEIIRTAPFLLPQSVELLDRRTEGMPLGLSALCHVLAGGLPREVIRNARHVARGSSDEPTVLDALHELVAEDVAEKVRGTRVVLSSRALTRETEVMEGWLNDIDARSKDASQLVAACSTSPCDAVGSDLREHVIGVATLAYISATVQELAGLGDHRLEILIKRAPELANARFALGSSPVVAWTTCDRVRTDSGLQAVVRPWGVAERDNHRRSATA
jgi:hypothetical protein